MLGKTLPGSAQLRSTQATYGSFTGVRNIVGVPTEPVDPSDARLGPFLQAVDQMTAASHLMLVCDASPQALHNCCPGGMSFLHASLQGSASRRLSYHWMDCARFWIYYDWAQGCNVRSARHLYLSLENLLAKCRLGEIFLLRPGSPFIGDELASMWMNECQARTRVFDAPSPIQTTVDLVEELLTHRCGTMPRFQLSGPEFLALPLSHLSVLKGLIAVRSISDFYAASAASPSLCRQLANVVMHLATSEMRIFLCHIGLRREIVPCRPDEILDKLTHASNVCSPWTLILVNYAGTLT